MTGNPNDTEAFLDLTTLRQWQIEDPEGLEEIIELYGVQSEKYLLDLRQFLESNQLDQAAIAAHRWAGAAATCGLTPLADQLRKMEAACHSGSADSSQLAIIERLHTKSWEALQTLPTVQEE